MNEQLLVEALRADERLAPDPSEVLAGVAGGIRRRRHRRVVVYAAALAALLSALVFVPRQAEPVAEPVVATFDRTVRFGWLPEYVGTPSYSVFPAGESVAYVKYDSVPALRVDVWRADWQSRLDRSSWQPVQVAGRPGWLVSRPSRTVVEWQLPSGRWAHLEYGLAAPGEVSSQPELQTAAERIAAGMTEGPPEPVRVAFGLTHLPAGMRIASVRGVTEEGYGSIEIMPKGELALRTTQSRTEEGIAYDMPTIDPSARIIASFLAQGWTTLPQGVSRTDKIGGRPAYRLDGDEGIAVDWSPHGWFQVANGLPGPPSRLKIDEYRAIAQGVRWLGR